MHLLNLINDILIQIDNNLKITFLKYKVKNYYENLKINDIDLNKL